MTISPEFVLSAREYEVLWSTLELRRMPYPLHVPSEGVTGPERAQVIEDARGSLRDKGLLHGDRFDADLVAALRVLANPEVSVDAVGYADGPLRGLAASDGGTAVLAALDNGHVALATIRPTALAPSVVQVMPSGQPGRGQAMSVSYQALRRAVEPDEADYDPFATGAERDALIRAGVPASDADTLLDLANNRVAGGQFGVNSADRRHGTMRRDPTVVSWFDTSEGRYLMVQEDGWLSLSPADDQRITARIDQLLAAA
ncbi:ESX secretion-associated protein EspG [Gandjariella thermophila]|uniref:ESX secretion-associated protein EspG n=1 Tax=Gandjariella thermophila TaxID=1931992 RepID=A0A4D4J220_9PSEU|nr:ESX secretion-associated protein EspG [Gandjariella thermophila]GDY29210.1 ESX secretion-associated protein EspG [Gandjariella thermophila]